jgi:hypothetical protein
MKWLPSDISSRSARLAAVAAVLLPLATLPFAFESLPGQRVLLLVWPFSAGLAGVRDMSPGALAIFVLLLLLNVLWYLFLLIGVSRVLAVVRRARGPAR